MATIYLSVSYGKPIFVFLVRGRRAVRRSTFSLEKFRFVINVVVLTWIFLAIVLFRFPTTKHNELCIGSFCWLCADKYIMVYYARKEVFYRPPVLGDIKVKHDGQVIGHLGRMTAEEGNTSNRSSEGKLR